MPGGAVVKNLPANAGDTRDAGSVLGLRIFPRIGNGNPLQYSAWEILWTEKSLAGYSPWGSQRAGHDWAAEHTNIYWASTISNEFKRQNYALMALK